MWNLVFFVIDAIIAISLVSLAAISLFRQGYKNSVNRLFAMFSITAAFWIVFSDTSNNVGVPSYVALYANRFSYAFALATAIFLLLIIMRFNNSKKYGKITNISAYILFALCAVSLTPFVIEGVVINGDLYGVIWGPLIWLYTAGLLYTFVLMMGGVVYGLRHTKGLKMRQLVSIGIGLGIAVPPILLLNLLIPLFTGVFWVLRFGATPAAIVVISLYYSIVRYHLLDIRLAAVRTLTYILSLGALVAIFYSLAVIMSGVFNNHSIFQLNQNPLSIIVELGLLLIFQPIKRFFDHLTNRVFYRDYYDSDEFFARFNRILTSTADLRNLLEQSAAEIATTIKSEQAFFFIHTSDDHYITAGTNMHSQLPRDDVLRLQSVYGKKNEVIIAP